MAPRVTLLLAVLTACHADDEWGPVNGVRELDAVEKALHKIVDSPLLTRAQLAAATHVVDDVEHVVAAVQSSNNLTKQARRQQLAGAIKELQGLQNQWSLAASGNQTAMEEKMQKLRGELAIKQALLNKTEGLLKLASLEKELAEKKLQLQGLMESKAKAEALHEEEKKQEAQQEAVVVKLVASAQVMASSSSALKVKGSSMAKSNPVLPGPLKAILAELEQSARNISMSIEHSDTEEKKREAQADSMIKAHGLATSKANATLRGQSILKLVAQRASHQYKKTRAVKVAQLAELKEGIRSIENGDVVTLRKLMSKMQQEVKSLQGKSHSFLY